MDRKRILIIIGIVALIIAFGVTIYFVIFRQKTKVADDLPPLTKEEQQRLKLTTEERQAGITEDQKIKEYAAVLPPYAEQIPFPLILFIKPFTL